MCEKLERMGMEGGEETRIKMGGECEEENGREVQVNGEDRRNGKGGKGS